MPVRKASILMVLVAATSVARADDEVPSVAMLTPPQDRYTVRFEPSAFYAAPGGELIMPGSPSGTIAMDLGDLDLDKPRVSPYGEFHIRRDDWRVTLTSFAVSLDQVETTAAVASQLGPLAIGVGDRVFSSMDFGMGELLVAKQLGGPDKFNGVVDPDFAMAFEVFGGVRFYHVAFDFAAPSGAISADEFFIHPIVGGKCTMNVLERFDIDLQIAVGGMPTGGDRSSLSIEIINGYTYRPIENVGIQVGYRLSYYSLNSGTGASEFEYSGAVAGVFAGVVIRF